MPENMLDRLQPQDDTHLYPDTQDMSDRELLEYVAENMLTPDMVIAVITEKLPEILKSLESSPLVRTLLKFM